LVEKRINHNIHNFFEYYDEKIGEGWQTAGCFRIRDTDDT